MKNHIVHIILMVLLASTAFAQSEIRTIDSLKQAAASQKGREKAETMLELSRAISNDFFDEGVAIDDEAARIAHDCGATDLEARLYYRNGYLFLYHDDLDLSKEYLHKSLKLYEQIDDSAYLFEVYWCLALGDMWMGNLDSAAFYYEKAVVTADKTGDMEAKMDAINNLGAVYHEQGDFDNVLKCYDLSNKIAMETNDTLLLAQNGTNLAVIYSENGNWEKAKPIFMRMIPFWGKAEDYSALVTVYLNLGMIYEKSYINYDSALYYLNASAELAETIKEEWQLAESLCEIGNVFALQERYQEALEKYNESLSLAQSVNYQVGQMQSLAGLGEVYYKKGDHSRSLDCFLQCRELGTKYGIGLYETAVRSALIRNYACLGRVKEMEEEMKRFADDYDKVCFQNSGFLDENKNIFQNIANISQQYEELLTQSEQQNRQMRAYRLAFFGLLALVLSTFLVLLLHYFRKNH